jgi:EAL domain-containing protein (putative c-di-GMP-specific phosphodiesterase class I)
LDETALRRAAEEAGLLDQLTEWSLAAACEQLRRWRQGGLRGMHLAVPILSQRQLRWSGLCERLGELVRQAGAAPRELEIEIDERLLHDEVASGGRTLEGLHRLGVRLAVADFGRAGGALGLLREAGLSTVKLGPSLLEGIVEEPARYTLAVGVLRVARELGLRTVGAGVRTEEQLRLLRDEGADAVQDLLRAPPQPVEAATEWLAQAMRRA